MRDLVSCSICWGIIALISGVINYLLRRTFAISSSVSPIISFFLALTLWCIGLLAFMVIYTKENKR